jgi:hypothetical protein
MTTKNTYVSLLKVMILGVGLAGLMPLNLASLAATTSAASTPPSQQLTTQPVKPVDNTVVPAVVTPANTPVVTPTTVSTPPNTATSKPANTAAPVTPQVAPAQATTMQQPLTGNVVVTTLLNANDATLSPNAMLVTEQLNTAIHNDLLKKKCDARTITLTNKTNAYMEVLQVEVVNSLNATAIAQEEAQASQRRKAIGAGLLRIAASAIPYAGYGSYAAAQAVGIGSNVAYQASNMMNTPTPDASGSIAGYQQRVNHIMVNPGATVRFETLLPKAAPAQMQVTFKNLGTNQIYAYQVGQ